MDRQQIQPVQSFRRWIWAASCSVAGTGKATVSGLSYPRPALHFAARCRWRSRARPAVLYREAAGKQPQHDHATPYHDVLMAPGFTHEAFYRVGGTIELHPIGRVDRCVVSDCERLFADSSNRPINGKKCPTVSNRSLTLRRPAGSPRASPTLWQRPVL